MTTLAQLFPVHPCRAIVQDKDENGNWKTTDVSHIQASKEQWSMYLTSTRRVIFEEYEEPVVEVEEPATEAVVEEGNG